MQLPKGKVYQLAKMSTKKAASERRKMSEEKSRTNLEEYLSKLKING